MTPTKPCRPAGHHPERLCLAAVTLRDVVALFRAAVLPVGGWVPLVAGRPAADRSTAADPPLPSTLTTPPSTGPLCTAFAAAVTATGVGVRGAVVGTAGTGRLAAAHRHQVGVVVVVVVAVEVG